MAFSDPQSITIDGVPTSLPRTSSGENRGEFTSQDGNIKLTVSTIYGKRIRRAIRVYHAKVAPDPLISSTNIKYSLSATVVVDQPLTGYSVTEAKQIVDGLIGVLTASSGAALLKLLGGEN